MATAPSPTGGGADRVGDVLSETAGVADLVYPFELFPEGMVQVGKYIEQPFT